MGNLYIILKLIHRYGAMENKKKFIVVEGPIGVGKTTLATKLAHTLNSKLLLENFSNNPFLKNFYKDIKRYALPTQLCFLLQRFNEFTDKKYNEIFDNSLISDYFLDKDKLFAEITLANDELILYKRIFKELNIKTPKPDLIIYLQADSSVLINRIKSRKISFEQDITEKYLQSVIDVYTNYFYNYDESPLLIINTSSVDVNKPHDYSMLLQEINKEVKGKKYFNPSTLSN